MLLKNNQNTTSILVIATFKLSLIGVVIGLFHAYDFYIMLLLLFYIIRKAYLLKKSEYDNFKVLIIGMILTGIVGYSAELWGVGNGYWAYHDLSNARIVPHWLFFSWMLAFYFLYKLECQLIDVMKLRTLKHKFILTLLISMIFPVFGEIITINLGVWTYYWPMQFLGVPLYATIALIMAHMFVNLLMVIILKKLNIQDPLFSLSLYQEDGVKA